MLMPRIPFRKCELWEISFRWNPAKWLPGLRSPTPPHHFLEATGFTAQASGFAFAGQRIHTAAGLVRRGGGIERRAFSAPHIAVQSELRDHEQAAARVLHAAVHLAIPVFKMRRPAIFSARYAHRLPCLREPTPNRTSKPRPISPLRLPLFTVTLAWLTRWTTARIGFSNSERVSSETHHTPDKRLTTAAASL